MGPYLSKPKKDKTYSFGFNKRRTIRYICCGMQGWRKNMEDAHLASTDLNDKYSLFGVFDGHGGHEVAKFCERHFPDVLLQKLEYYKENPEQALIDAFLEMDSLLNDTKYKRELIRLKQQRGIMTSQKNEELESENMKQVQQKFDDDDNYEEVQFSCSFVGCTANVVLCDNYTGEIIIANAGDAKCVLMKDGNVIELTIDHKPEDEKEKERIENAGGQIFAGRVNGKLNVSRAIGDLEFKKNDLLNSSQQLVISVPDITRNQFTGKGIEFFIIGCDGVWEKMGCNFVLEKLQEVDLLEQLFDDIISPSYTENPKGCDNMSIVVVLNNTEEIQKLEPIIESKFLNEGYIPIKTDVQVISSGGVNKVDSETFIVAIEEEKNNK